MTTTSLTTTSGNVTVGSGSTLLVETGGMALGITVASGGTVIGEGGTLSGGSLDPVSNDGIIKTGSSGFIAILGSATNSGTIVASATGSGGDAQILIAGGTLLHGGTIEAIATSAHTSAVVNLSDNVSGGLISADGPNARVYIDGASISGASLRTADLGVIGVFGGGTATVTDGTVSSGASIFDDGALTFSGGSVGSSVSALVEAGTLTFSAVTFAAKDNLAAEYGGTLVISGANTNLSAGTIVGASLDGNVVISGNVDNAGTLEATARGGVNVSDTLTITAGSGGTVLNGTTGLIEAEAISGYFGSAVVNISAGSTITNSGIIEALATDSYFGEADIHISGGTVANSKTIEAIATSNTTASGTVDGASAVTNNGSMAASASDDSAAYLSVDTSGGTISNTKTIDVVATADATVGLNITDSTSGTATLTNAKSASIEVSLSNESFLQNLAIDVGNITNSGTIAEVVASDSYINTSGGPAADNFIDGSNLNNAGTIEASATGTSHIYDLKLNITSTVSNAGTIETVATGNSESNIILAGGFITNAETITATASTSGSAGITVSALGSGGSGALIDNAGTITAVATTGGTASIVLETAVTSGSSIVNSHLMEASAKTNSATLEILANGSGASITNTSTIEASATGGTAAVYLGGNGASTALNNLSGTLLATESAGTAFIDLGAHRASVTGGTLKSIGANAEVGVLEAGAGTAVDVAIAADSHIVGWAGTMSLNDIVGSICAGTIIQAAKDGTVDVNSNLVNAGIIEALGNSAGGGDVVVSAGSGGTIRNSNAIEVLNSGDGVNAFIEVLTGSGGGISNSGSIIGSANLNFGGATNVTMSGGTVSNSTTGKIEIVATSNSYDYTSNYASVEATTIVNSGTMLASASASSDDYLFVSGGSVTNAKTIEASAVQQSYAEVDIFGNSIVNSGTIEATGGVDSEAVVYLGGTVLNSGGTISAAGNGAVNLDTVTISGGKLATTGSEAAIVAGANKSGAIVGSLIAKDSFVVALASGSVTLGNEVVIGSGAVVEATGVSGTVSVAGGATVTNSGTLLAEFGGELLISGGVVNSGAGSVVVGYDGIVDVVSGGSANIAFAPLESGTLQIADVVGNHHLFSGSVTGFGGVDGEFPGQLIDLADVATSGGTDLANYSASYASVGFDVGTLTVTSGGTADVAVITLDGNYSNASFNIVDYHGTIAVSDPVSAHAGTTSSTANVALLGSYIASLFASPEGLAVTPTTTETGHGQAPLAHPHHT